MYCIILFCNSLLIMMFLLHWHLALTKGISIHIPSMNVDLKAKCNKILQAVCCFVPLSGYSVHVWYIKMCIRASIIFLTQLEPEISTTNVHHILFFHLFFHFLRMWNIIIPFDSHVKVLDLLLWLSTLLLYVLVIKIWTDVGFPLCTCYWGRKEDKHVDLLTDCFIDLYICIIHTNLKYSK